MIDIFTIKKQLILSAILSFIFFILFFLLKSNIYKICPTVFCENILNYFGLISILGPASLLQLCFIYIKKNIELTRCWVLLLKVYLSIYLSIYLFIPWYVGDAFVNLQKDILILVISCLFFVISWFSLIIKLLKTPKNT